MADKSKTPSLAGAGKGAIGKSLQLESYQILHSNQGKTRAILVIIKRKREGGK